MTHGTLAPGPLPDLLVVEDVARALRVGTTHARRLIAAGAVPGVRRGRRWYVRRSDLLEALRPDRDRGPAAAAAPAGAA